MSRSTSTPIRTGAVGPDCGCRDDAFCRPARPRSAVRCACSPPSPRRASRAANLDDDLGGATLLQGAGCNVIAMPGPDGALMIDGGLAANADALLALSTEPRC